MSNGDGKHNSGSGTEELSAGDRIKDRIIRALKRYVGEETDSPQSSKIEKLSCRQKYRARDLEPPPPNLRKKT